MEHMTKSNKLRSSLLTIIDQELKSNEAKAYFAPKESTLIESFRVEFEEFFNCSQQSSNCVERLMTGNSNQESCSIETQTAANSNSTASESTLLFHRRSSSENKSKLKEHKQVLREICYALRSKHAISKKINRRPAQLKTEVVNKSAMNQFRETIIQQTQIRRTQRKKSSEKVSNDSQLDHQSLFGEL